RIAIRTLSAVTRSIRASVRMARITDSEPSVHLGRDVSVMDSLFGRHVAIGDDSLIIRSTLGDYSYCGFRCSLVHATVGKFCSIGSEVQIGLGTHPTKKFVSTHPATYLHRPGRGWTFVEKDLRAEFTPTRIGNDVWCGLRAMVVDGVEVGDGAILA